MAIDKFDLGSTPILKKTLDTDETVVTITVYQDGVIVPINTSTATQIPADSGRWEWEVDFVTKPTSGVNQYEYNFYGATYHQSRWGLFVWEEDQSRYNGVVTLNTSTGAAGIGYPTGTNYQPVNNLIDAITIAQRINTKTIYVTGDISLTTDVSGYIFNTDNHSTASIDLNGQNTTDCTFSNFSLIGNTGGYNFTANDCWLYSLTNCNLNGFFCALAGDFTVSSTGALLLQNSTTSSATGITVDCNGTGSFGIGKWDGILTLSNMNSPFSYCAATGNMIIVLHPTITAGNFYIGGIGQLQNYATATTTLTNLLLPFASFNEALTQYTTAGTAGYVQRLSAYGGKIYINTSTGVAGTAFPAGTPFAPVDNLADAITIAGTIGSKTINLTGSLSLTQPVPGYVFESPNVSTAIIDLNNADITDSTFNTITLTDGTGGYSFTANNCQLQSLENCNFNGFECVLFGDFTVAPGGQFRTQDSSVGSATGLTIDCNGTGSVGFGGWVGILTIGNLTNSLSYVAVTGEAVIVLLPTITAGNMYFAGQGRLNNYATATTTLINYMLPYAVFDENLAQYVTQGTAGHTIRLGAYGNKVYINTSTGSAGTTFPIGAAFAPVNNLTDAKAIALANGIKEFVVIGALTLDSDVSDYNFLGGRTFLVDSIDLNGQAIDSTTFSNLTITGAANGICYFEECTITDVTNINCYAQRTQFSGTVTIAPGGSIQGSNVFAGAATGGLGAIFDLGYDATASLIMTDFSGIATVKALAGGYCVLIGNGVWYMDSTIVAGLILDIGAGLVTRNYTPSAFIIHFSYTVPYSVFNEVLTQYTIPGTAGHAIAMTAFQSAVWLDTSSGITGTTFPTGTSFRPVNNIADARTIADVWGVTSIRFKGTLVLDQEYSGWRFSGNSGANNCVIDLNNQDVSKALFEGCTLTGACNGKINAITCNMYNMTNLDGYFLNTSLQGSFTLATGTIIGFLNGYLAGTTTTIDMNGAASLSMAEYVGDLVLDNLTAGERFFRSGSGLITFNASCTGGSAQLDGIGHLTNNGTGITITNNMVPCIILNDLLFDHTTPNTVGEALNKIYDISTSTGNITTSLEDIKGTGFVKDTDSLVNLSHTDIEVTAQIVRDAMKLAPSAGDAATGSVDAKLDEILAAEGEGGSATVTITIVDGDDIPIQDAYVEIWNSGLTAIVTYGITDSNGQMQKTTDDGVYKVKVRKGGYTFNDPFDLTVVGDTSAEYEGATYIIDPASDLSLCRIYGYITDGAETPLEGTSICAVPYDSPTLLEDTNIVVSSDTVTAITTSTGKFTIDLIQNVKFTISIPEIGFRKTILVPNETGPIVLWSLTDVFISGDPTNPNPNW